MEGDADQTLTLPSITSPTGYDVIDDNEAFAGGNLLLKWRHEISDVSNTMLKFYYDRTERADTLLVENRDTVDFEFEHRFPIGGIHDIVWGVGYHITTCNAENRFTVQLEDETRTDSLFSAFIQDEIQVIEDELNLTIGSKFEHNDYTGFEVQPSGRVAWQPLPGHSFWASVSRAVRTPSLVDHDVNAYYAALPPGPPFFINTLIPIVGDSDFESEELLAYEAGYRTKPFENITLDLDLALFFNDYDNLRSLEPATASIVLMPAPHILAPMIFDNKLQGESYGLEIAANWQPFDYWRLASSVAYINIHLKPDDSSGDTVSEDDENDTPHTQAQIRSYLNLPWDLQFDTFFYYVDSKSTTDIPSYVRMDLRLGWQAFKNFDISLIGQNLLDDHHPEGKGIWANNTEVERSVYLSVTGRF